MDRLAIGLVRTSHGIKGNIKVVSLSGQREHFLPLKQVTLRKEGWESLYQVEEVKSSETLLLMKLRGIDSPEEAKRLAGAEILVPRKQAAPLEEGEFYQADLQGCRVVHGGEVVGVVKSIFQGGAADLLEVVTDEGAYLVPFQSQYIGDIDVKGKNLHLKAPWLLE